jgi:aldose sugar dehydrogenase
LQTGYDELNLIERGANYGWPIIQGNETHEGMKTPILNSGPTTTWAPASTLYRDGKIYFGGLRGERLYEADISSHSPSLKEYYAGAFGRIRTVIAGPDGALYLTTSNKDGRGTPKAGDDKVIRLDLK